MDMTDIDTKRRVLQELMDLMDQHERDNMGPSLMGDAQTAAPAAADDMKPESQELPADEPDGDDDDDMKSIDPLVLLAKRMGRK